LELLKRTFENTASIPQEKTVPSTIATFDTVNLPEKEITDVSAARTSGRQ
jgi:hypothetical protein